MGVRGLQTYIDNYCPDVKQRVCLFDLAEQHGRCFNLVPKLVIDGMAFINSFYDKGSNLEWIYGGQWLEYSILLQQFSKAFKDRNIKLTFFFDGCVVADKRPEWVNRRIYKSSEIAKLFDYLKMHQKLSKEFEQFQTPTSLGSLSSLAIKILNPEVEVYATLNDADIEIADYARKHKEVFGILSNDTDFIIFDSKPYLSARDIDYKTMYTTSYDRQRLSQHLSLPLQEFPLFSCLLGNDIMTKDLLQRLHRRLRRPLPDAISTLIRRQYGDGQQWRSQEHKLGFISLEICGNESLKEKLSRGIATYTDFYLPVSATCMVGLRSNNCAIFSGIFNIYKHRVCESSEVLEDYRDTSLPSTNLAYRPIRKRLYAIIFNNMRHNKSGSNQVVIREWCAYYGNNMVGAECVYPSYIPQLEDVPPLEELWQQSFSTRLKYFVTSLQSKLTETEIQALEPKFVTLCCIINYLLTTYRSNTLKKFEVVAFIAQAVCIQNKTPQEIHAIEGPNIETRAIQLCSLFMRGVSTIILALGVCGYPISCENAMPWNYFDGKVFHKMYGLAKKATPIQNLIESKVIFSAYSEIYHSLPLVVITHFAFWGHNPLCILAFVLRFL